MAEGVNITLTQFEPLADWLAAVGGTGAASGTTDPNASDSGASSDDWLGSLFKRTAIIILGFIFVSAGLAMFKSDNGKVIVGALAKGS